MKPGSPINSGGPPLGSPVSTESRSPSSTAAISWNNVAIEYERRVEPFTTSFVQEMLEPFLPLGQNEKNRLLDLGCGCGKGSSIASDLGFDDVVACDLSPEMIARTKRRYPHITSMVADGQNLPFDNEFDFCMSAFSVIFFPDVGAGLQQIKNSLVEGGRVVISAWGDPTETPAFQIFPTAIQQEFPEFVHSSKPRRLTGAKDSLTQLFEEAGLEEISVVGPIERHIQVPTAEDFYNRFALTSSSPNIISLLQKLDEHQNDRLRNAVMELATTRSDKSDCISIPSSCYFAYGKKPTEDQKRLEEN